MRKSLAIGVFVTFFMLVGCNLPQPAQPTPSNEQVETEVNQLLTRLPSATTVLSTPTFVPPTSTEEVLPTQTATSEPSQTPTVPLSTTTQSATDPRLTLGTPTWSDNLDTGRNFFIYTDDHVKVEEKSGFLAMTAKNADGWHSWTLSYPDLTNFYLETTAQPGACSGTDRYGLVFRSPENNQGYIYGFSCDGQFSLRKWDGKNFTTIVDWTQNEAIKSGADQSNRLGIMVKGNQFTLYANGVQVGQASDSSYTQGTLGFFTAASSTANFTAQFDEVAYWDLP